MIVIVGCTLTKDRLYLGNNEIYREKTSGSLDLERETLHISDSLSDRWRNARRIALVDTKTYDGGMVGSPTNEIRYQMGNHLQSASLELDDSAAIISYEEYHPFGTSAYRLGRTSTEVALKRYRYLGKERDEESGMYNNGARYYTAWLGKFVSADPKKDKYPQVSPFSYSLNNPITYKDSNGKEVEITVTSDEESGNKRIEIHFTAVIVNDSYNSFTVDQAEQLKSLIEQAVAKGWNRDDIEGYEIVVKSDIEIYTTKNNEDKEVVGNYNDWKEENPDAAGRATPIVIDSGVPEQTEGSFSTIYSKKSEGLETTAEVVGESLNVSMRAFESISEDLTKKDNLEKELQDLIGLGVLSESQTKRAGQLQMQIDELETKIDEKTATFIHTQAHELGHFFGIDIHSDVPGEVQNAGSERELDEKEFAELLKSEFPYLIVNPAYDKTKNQATNLMISERDSNNFGYDLTPEQIEMMINASQNIFRTINK